MSEMKLGGTPLFIEGGLGIDDRGQLAFVNDFHFEGVKRFYVVSNHCAGFVRAWHAHHLEAKYITVVQGAAIIGAVAIDNWDQPSKTTQVHRYVLSERKPGVVYIPPGYANGAMSLSGDTKIVYFSTATLEEARTDDIRYDARYWDIWHVVER